MTEKRKYLFKILVIGEIGTGKTCLVRRYVQNLFTEHYRTTIGVDFALKILKYDDQTVIRIQLWDIAGQERYGNMTRVFYRDAVGCLIVFDLTDNATFESVSKWKADLDNKVQLPDGSPLPCVLLANKCDLIRGGLSAYAEQIDAFCRDKGFVKWFETSAKENINIETAARFLVAEIMKHTEPAPARPRVDPSTNQISVKDSKEAEKEDRCC